MIAEGGVASITMRELGRRVGVSRGAAYRHFSDKEELLMSVASTGFQKLGKHMEAVVNDTHLNQEDQLKKLGEKYVRFALENPAYYRLMYGKESLSRWNQPVLKASGDSLFALLRETIEEFQRECGATHKDSKTLVYVAWSSVHGLASLLIEEQILVEVDIDAIIKQMLQTIVDGIKADVPE